MRRVANADSAEVQLPDGFEFIRLLGQGGQGTVVLAVDTRPEMDGEIKADSGLQKRVAIKCYARSMLADPKKRNQVRREVRSLQLLQHPHIIGFREVLLSPTHLCIVIDYAAGGSLFDVLCNKKTEVLTENAARRLFQQLITGVDYAHRKGLTNRDIKPDNILFYPMPKGKPPTLVLCDFGLSRSDVSGMISTMEGTTGYLAPELFTGQCKTVDQAKHADLYSCGVVLYQMLFGLGRRPTGLDNRRRVDAKIMRSWLHGQYRELEFPDVRPISADCRDFLSRILQANPRNRISIEEIWEHPWFRTPLSDQALKWNFDLLVTQDCAVQRYDIESLLEEACPTVIPKNFGCGFSRLRSLASLTRSLSSPANV